MFNDEFKEFLNDNGRTIDDFYCKSCGMYMLDDAGIENFKWRTKKNGTREPLYKRLHFNNGLIEPKKFNDNISLYRHTCWTCYFKMRKDVVDLAKKTRKSKFYSGDKIPRPNVLVPDFYLIYDISKDELENITNSKYNSASKESFIKRFGDIIGVEKYNEYCKRQGYTASSEYFIKDKGMSIKEASDYHKNRAVTLNNLIKRYGEYDGTRRYGEYCKRQEYAGCKLEYFIEKYGEDVG